MNLAHNFSISSSSCYPVRISIVLFLSCPGNRLLQVEGWQQNVSRLISCWSCRTKSTSKLDTLSKRLEITLESRRCLWTIYLTWWYHFTRTGNSCEVEGSGRHGHKELYQWRGKNNGNSFCVCSTPQHRKWCVENLAQQTKLRPRHWQDDASAIWVCMWECVGVCLRLTCSKKKWYDRKWVKRRADLLQASRPMSISRSRKGQKESKSEAPGKEVAADRASGRQDKAGSR